MVSFEIKKYDSNFFFFKIILVIQPPLRLHMNFIMDFLLMKKKIIGILIGIALNMQIGLGSTDILTIKYSFYFFAF